MRGRAHLQTEVAHEAREGAEQHAVRVGRYALLVVVLASQRVLGHLLRGVELDGRDAAAFPPFCRRRQRLPPYVWVEINTAWSITLLRTLHSPRIVINA